jgi:16S rRNA (guanine1207-N2)-methyltransferase
VSGQYFEPRPSARSRPGGVDLTLPDATLRLATDAAVFSPGRVDTGTKALLLVMGDHEPLSLPDGDLVDLGAGYGPIALTLALRHPDRTVWAVEVNERARALCEANAATAGVAERVRVVAPEQVPAGIRVAAVASNPPIRVGKAVLHPLLTDWLDRLAPGGEAWLVVQKHLGSDSLARWLAERGHPVQRVASRKGFRVLRVGVRPAAT